MNPTYRRRAILTVGFGGAAAWWLGANAYLPDSKPDTRLKNVFIKHGPPLVSILVSTKLEEYFSENETAIHEAGHAILAINQPETMRLLSVSIKEDSKEIAIGYTKIEYLRSLDQFSKNQIYEHAVLMMAGAAAEIFVYGDKHKPSGTGDDIKMTKKLAKIFYGEDATKQNVKKFVSDARDSAISVMKSNRVQLDALSVALLDKKWLSREEVYEVINADSPSQDTGLERPDI